MPLNGFGLDEIIAGIDGENQVRIEVEIQGLYKKTPYGAIVDTGFSGSLVVPLVTAVDIGLEKLGASTVTLADGTVKVLPTFLCKLRIGNVVQDADVLVMGNEVLIGMGILDQFKLCLTPATGKVTIEKAVMPATQPAAPGQGTGTRSISSTGYSQLVETLRRLTGR